MKRFAFTILFSLITCLLYGQVMTAYEKKIYSLKVQVLRKLGVSESVLKQSDKLSDLEALLVTGDLLQKLNTQNGLMLMLAYEREMKEAEKLKTEVDFQRDKKKKEEAERKKQIENTKQAERNRQWEIQKQEKEKKERYDNSDYVEIKNQIQTEYNLWLQKNEFEKSSDYQNRITNYSSVAFDSICYKTIVENIKHKSENYATLLKYNADIEKFGIEFSLNEFKFSDSIYVSLKDAAKFKEEFDQFKIYVAEKDWKFRDYYITPSKLTLFNNKNAYEFYLSNKDLRNIYLTTSELDINSNNGIINKFNYDEFYYNRIFQIKDASAINTLAWESLLNKKFSKALEILEKGIQLINAQDEVYPYLLTNLAHAFLFNNQFEKAHKIYFENLSLKLNGKIWKTAILEDFEEFRKRDIYSPDIEKIKQELLSLQSQPEDNEFQSEDKVYNKVEVEASFPGGNAAWTRYLKNNLDPNVPITNGAPIGTYEVIVRFIVNKDGSVSNVVAETKYGYGMEEEAIKVIKKGPNWVPALQDGRNVNAYRRQPLSFVISQN